MKLPNLPPEAPKAQSWRAAVERLQSPIWPLGNLLPILYLTGPFEDVGTLLAELPAPLETQHITYADPRESLLPYRDDLALLEALKTGGRTDPMEVSDGEGGAIDPFEAILLRLKQRMIERELEAINGLLCGPCQCTLCCTGPDVEARQEFFEIPLREGETALFDLPRVDTDASRRMAAQDPQDLLLDGVPYYRRPPALYHWHSGWSLILPRESACPNLDTGGRCRVYPHRPDVCRRPQIFALVLEPPSPDAADRRPVRRETLLAVLDCPYVRELKERIVEYAALSDLRMVFRENKA